MTMNGDNSPASKLKMRDTAQHWLAQVSTSGLSAGQTLNASYFVQYAGSLVGKELKLVCQTAATAFRPMVEQGHLSEDVWKIWRAIGDVGALIYQPSVAAENEESYFVSNFILLHPCLSLLIENCRRRLALRFSNSSLLWHEFDQLRCSMA